MVGAVKAVLFDLDGTLISYSASYREFLERLALRWGIEDPVDPFFEAYSGSIVSEGVVSFRSCVQLAFRVSGRDLPSSLSDDCDQAIEDYAAKIRVLPGALELIEKYPGVPKAIVSNGPTDMQRAALAASKLGSHFDHVLISGDEDVAVRKPNRVIFELACRRLGVLPAEALMIGDNMAADIEGATKAGLRSIHVSEFGSPALGRASAEMAKRPLLNPNLGDQT